MERLQISEQDVRDYCFFRLSEDSPQFAELHEEFIRDPVNSRVGQFSREAERIVRHVMNGDLDCEGLLLASDATVKTGEVPDEVRKAGSVESGQSEA